MEGVKVKVSLPPAVIVHGPADVQAVLAAGAAATLLSGPAAAGYAGCAWWRALTRDFTAGPHFLDCGDQAGRALEALRLGLPGIVLAAPDAVFAAVREMAAGATLVLATAPPALDMARRGAARRLAGWLAQGGGLR
jgi:DNA-binding NarL/FixJ family response regulator